MSVTVVTGSLRHNADGSLLLAGGSAEETLVLVRVSVGAADRNVLLVALKQETRRFQNISEQKHHQDGCCSGAEGLILRCQQGALSALPPAGTYVELTDTFDVGSVLAADSSEATRSGVAHAQIALLVRQI